MLTCDIDPGYYIELIWPHTSPGTEICVECRRLIPPGEEHYRVREYSEYESLEFMQWVEPTTGIRACCEECGDLAASLMELGYCWDYTQLRNDIKELNDF